MLIDDKFTHEILETFNWERLDVILQCIPVDDKFTWNISTTCI